MSVEARFRGVRRRYLAQGPVLDVRLYSQGALVFFRRRTEWWG